MDRIDAHRITELLIEFFETGNSETDSVAKYILHSAADYTTYWKDEIDRIQSGPDWTGIRVVEAEIICHTLRTLSEKSQS